MKWVLQRGLFALGFVGGFLASILVLLFSEAFFQGLLSDPTIRGALVGGLIAGGISLGATLIGVIAASRERIEDRREREAAHVSYIFLKQQSLADGLTKARRHFMTEDPQVIVYISGVGKAWKPLSNFGVLPNFTNDERALLIRWRDIGLTNQINDLVGLIDHINYLMRHYQEKFDESFGPILFSKDASVSDRQVSLEAEPNRAVLLYLSDVRAHILSACQDGIPSVEAFAEEFSIKTRTKVGFALKYEIKPDAPAHAQAKP